jgi:hypothetical protein
VLGTLVVMAIVIAVGTRASDAVEVRQQEVILHNLPEADAVAYYQVLRRRLRKVMVLRAVALVSMLTLFYVYKRHLGPPAPAVTERR